MDIAFSPDSRWLASTSRDGVATLWDFQTGKRLGKFSFKDRGSSVAFSPDGQWLSISSWDNTIKLVSLQDLTDLKVISLYPHRSRVLKAVFSPESLWNEGKRWLASASQDRTIRLWDLDNLDELPVIFRGHTGKIGNVIFSPNGRWIASSSNDRTARVWRLRINELTELACRTARRNLTLEEWDQFLGKRTYRKTCPNLDKSAP